MLRTREINIAAKRLFSENHIQISASRPLLLNWLGVPASGNGRTSLIVSIFLKRQYLLKCMICLNKASRVNFMVVKALAEDISKPQKIKFQVLKSYVVWLFFIVSVVRHTWHGSKVLKLKIRVSLRLLKIEYSVVNEEYDEFGNIYKQVELEFNYLLIFCSNFYCTSRFE